MALVGLVFVGWAWGNSEPGDRNRRRTPIVEAYERARDSVVNISTKQKVETYRMNIFGDLFALPAERTGSVGSGVVIHADGYIATNAHVVAAADQLSVTFPDASTYEARVIGRDSARDLAVIKIEANKPLTPIAWGSSDDLMIGEPTIAIGNPVGLQNTVTTGVISALHRELNIAERVVYKDVIQTDASINPGNSGGPLLNALGELIGINTAIRTDAQNIGFAIPVDQLRELLPDILDSEKLNRAVVGMRVTDNLPARVVAVSEGSPAHKAGVKLGDVVEAVNGRPLLGPVDFYVSLLQHEAGEAVALKLLRNGTPTSTRITLAPVPKADGVQLAARLFGLKIEGVNEKAARQFGWKKPGVIVTAVEPNSPAARAEFLPGDLLVQIHRHEITHVDQVGRLLDGIEPGTPVVIGILRSTRRGLLRDEVRMYAR